MNNDKQKTSLGKVEVGWEAEHGEREGFWVVIKELVNGDEVGFSSKSGWELLKGIEKDLEELTKAGRGLKDGDKFSYYINTHISIWTQLTQEQTEACRKTLNEARKNLSKKQESVIDNLFRFNASNIYITSDNDILKLKQDLEYCLNNPIKDLATYIGGNWKLETSGTGQAIIKGYSDTKKVVDFLYKMGYEYCLENYESYERYFARNLSIYNNEILENLNEARREVGGNYVVSNDTLEKIQGTKTKEFLRQYPIFAKYPAEVIFIIEDLFHSEKLKNIILNKESELKTITIEDLKFLQNASYFDDFNRVRYFQPIENFSLKALIAYIKLHHDDEDAWYFLKDFEYLSRNADKKIVIKAISAYSNSGPSDKIWKILNEAEEKKDWRELLKYKKLIQEFEYSRLYDKETEEMVAGAPEKEEWVKKLSVDFGGYRFRVLDSRDPLHLQIGIITDCCQRLGGAGEAAAIDSLINPKAGVLILEDKEGEIIAQSYFHYVPPNEYASPFKKRHGYILDNVEVNPNSYSAINLDEAYHKLGIWAKENLGIDFFECGAGYNKLNNDSFGKRVWKYDPRVFAVEEEYTDWDPGKSLNLLEYKPSGKGRDRPAAHNQNIEVLQPAVYTENIGKVRSPKFHGKLREMVPRVEKKDRAPSKVIRRKQEGILEELGIGNITYALSLPIVKEITNNIIGKRMVGGDYTGDMERLREYLDKKKVALYILEKYGPIFLKNGLMEFDRKKIIEVLGRYDEGEGEGESQIGEEKQLSFTEPGEEWKEEVVKHKTFPYGIRQLDFFDPYFKINNRDEIENRLPKLSDFPENIDELVKSMGEEEWWKSGGKRLYEEFREEYKETIKVIGEIRKADRNLPTEAEYTTKIADKKLSESLMDIGLMALARDIRYASNDIMRGIKGLSPFLLRTVTQTQFIGSVHLRRIITELIQFQEQWAEAKERYFKLLNEFKEFINNNEERIKHLDDDISLTKHLKFKFLDIHHIISAIKSRFYDFKNVILNVIFNKANEKLDIFKKANTAEELYNMVKEYIPEINVWEKMILRGRFGDFPHISAKYFGELLLKELWDRNGLTNHLRYSVTISELDIKKLYKKSEEEIARAYNIDNIVKDYIKEILVNLSGLDLPSMDLTKGGEIGMIERVILEPLGLPKDPDLIKFLMQKLNSIDLLSNMRESYNSWRIQLTWKLANKLGKKDFNNLIKIYDKLNTKEYFDLNKIDLIVAGIRGINTIDTDIATTAKILKIIHNSANNIDEEVIKGILGTKNISQLASNSDIVNKYYELMMTILSLGGKNEILKKYKVPLNDLEERGTIRPGFEERIEDFADTIRMGTEIHPKKKNFEAIKKLINELSSDINLLMEYNTYIKYYNAAKKKDERLYLLNMDLGGGLRFRVLKDLDPEHFQVGIDTDCCQRQGGAGESAMVDSFINPMAGVLVLEHNGNLVAQSYFHYVKNNGYILDNVEVAPRYEGKDIDGHSIEEIYGYWAKEKKEELGVKYISAGTGYSGIKEDEFGTLKVEKDPRTFAVEDPYTDWSANRSIDLTAPKFEIKEMGGIYEKVGRLSEIFIKVSNYV